VESNHFIIIQDRMAPVSRIVLFATMNTGFSTAANCIVSGFDA
jgi:hypothetical protein